jgi:hypothetical protein
VCHKPTQKKEGRITLAARIIKLYLQHMLRCPELRICTSHFFHGLSLFLDSHSQLIFTPLEILKLHSAMFSFKLERQTRTCIRVSTEAWRSRCCHMDFSNSILCSANSVLILCSSFLKPTNCVYASANAWDFFPPNDCRESTSTLCRASGSLTWP